jgi:Amt family ammonium transporter
VVPIHIDIRLFNEGYHDFAGSGAIHLTGAIGALTTTWMLKPRTNRFNPHNADDFEPNNPTYITLSTLSLYFCWMFFNAGSSFAISGDNIYVVATAGMNTMLSGASGGITVFVIHYLMNRNTSQRYSLVMICNGNLAGLVAVTGYIRLQ